MTKPTGIATYLIVGTQNQLLTFLCQTGFEKNNKTCLGSGYAIHIIHIIRVLWISMVFQKNPKKLLPTSAFINV